MFLGFRLPAAKRLELPGPVVLEQPDRAVTNQHPIEFAQRRGTGRAAQIDQHPAGDDVIDRLRT